MELPDLVLSPGRRIESVMHDRRHHEESGLSGIEAWWIQSVCSITVLRISQELPPAAGAAHRTKFQAIVAREAFAPAMVPLARRRSCMPLSYCVEVESHRGRGSPLDHGGRSWAAG